MAAIAVAMALVVGLLGAARRRAPPVARRDPPGPPRPRGEPRGRRARPQPAAADHRPRPTAPGAPPTGVPGPRHGDAPLGAAADLTGTLPDGGARPGRGRRGRRTARCWPSCPRGAAPASSFWDALAGPRRARPARRRHPGRDRHQRRRVGVAGRGGRPSAAGPGHADVGRGMGRLRRSRCRPYFVLVDGPSGRVVGEGSGTSWEQILDLLGRAAADAELVSRRDHDAEPDPHGRPGPSRLGGRRAGARPASSRATRASTRRCTRPTPARMRT